MGRRAFVLAVTVSLLLTLLFSPVVTGVGPPSSAVTAHGNPGSSDWPMFGHSPNRTSTTPVQALGNESIWEHKTAVHGAAIPPTNPGHPAWVGGWRLLGSPVVIYHPDLAKSVVYYGSQDFYLYGLDAKEGTEIWKKQIGYETRPEPMPGPYRDRKSRSTPAVVLNSTGKYVVYVGTGGRHNYAAKNFVWPSGTVTALDAATGALLWNVSTANLIESSPTVIYQPTLGKQVVYVGWALPRWVQADAITIPTNGGVLALDANTGGVIWNASVYDLIKDGYPSIKGDGGMVVGRGPAVSQDNDTVYVTAFNEREASLAKDIEGWVIALNAVDGSKKWIVKMDARGWSSPCVVGDVVYVGYGYPELNETTWGSIPNPPGISIYRPAYGGVLALSRVTGAVIWNWSQSGGPIDSSPAYYNEKIIVGSNLPEAPDTPEGTDLVGAVYCLNAATGALIWNYTAMGNVRSSPAVGGGLVYVGDIGQDYVYALNANTTNPTGDLIWMYKVRGSVWGSPAVAEVDGKPIVYITAEEAIPEGQSDPQEQTLYAITRLTAGSHDVAVTEVIGNASSAFLGQSVQVNITVENVGDFFESFSVTAYQDDNPIGTQSVADLRPGANATLTFTWNTTGVALGTYTLKGLASAVPDEADPANNVLTDGTVEILSQNPVASSTYSPIPLWISAAVAAIAIPAAALYLAKARKPKG